MNNKMEQAKNLYQSIETPIELNQRVNAAIDKAQGRKQKSFLVGFKPLSVSLATACLVFVMLLNTSQVFAETVYPIPVIGSIARVFTFREYNKSDEAYTITVKAPSIKGTGSTDLEKRINQSIQEKVEDIIKAAEKRAEENRQMIIDEGRAPEELPYFTVQVDYQIKSSTEKILSFVINHTESFANTYTYQTFYNIDLKTGKELTLTDLLGENYKEIVFASINKQINERKAENQELMYYSEDEIRVLLDDLKFYINNEDHVVISFDKGEIAPPPVGLQEFEMTQ